MALVEMRGTSGYVRAAYQVAAHFTNWRVDAAGRVLAESASVDEEYIEGPGRKSLWLKMGTKYWVWREIEIVSTAPFCVSVIGSPDVRDAEGGM